MSKDDDYSYHENKKIDEKYRLKDLERQKLRDRLKADSARAALKDYTVADTNKPREPPSEMEALTEMYRKRDDILDEIAKCPDLSSALKTDWSQRLTSILLLPDAASKLDDLTEDVDKASKEEYRFLLSGGMISSAEVLQITLSLIGDKLTTLATMACLFQAHFRS